MVINPIVGVYIPIIRIPIKGGMTIPNIAAFDHGTFEEHQYMFQFAREAPQRTESTCDKLCCADPDEFA